MTLRDPKEASGKTARIMILATGGTIAGAAETGTQSGYTSGQVWDRYPSRA
jgi:L-asparaginase/Glu-tRNA(Gln) amidotransferase subunit D